MEPLNVRHEPSIIKIPQEGRTWNLLMLDMNLQSLKSPSSTPCSS